MNTVTAGLIDRDSLQGAHDVRNNDDSQRWQERCWALLGYWPDGDVEKWKDLTMDRRCYEN